MIRDQIWLLLVMLSLGQVLAQTTPESHLKSVYERVFSRRKRAIIFPPGSFFKFTLNFGKGLLSTYPRGISFTLEEAVYFPIPGTRDDLYPKRFLPKKTTTPQPLTTTEATYVYIPGTDWRFKAQALPKKKPRPQTHRIDVGGSANPYKWQKWAKYGANQAQKTKTSYTKQWMDHKKWSKWTTPAPKWKAEWMDQSSWSRWTTAAPTWTADWRNHWQAAGSRPASVVHRHYHGHRDRRQLFDHFSGLSNLFGFDVKSCVLRTICDSKRLLLPPGYSMLQDMLRLVFTMPRLDGMEDDYTRVMGKDADQCAQELKTKCNMNLLIWLLSARYEDINKAL